MKDIKEFSQARKTYSRDTPKNRNVEKILRIFLVGKLCIDCRGVNERSVLKSGFFHCDVKGVFNSVTKITSTMSHKRSRAKCIEIPERILEV
jgi:hypothetical protein